MAGEQSIQLINALAFARGTQEPTNRNVLWIDDSIVGALYKRVKIYDKDSESWVLSSRTDLELLSDLRTVDGAGSGLDADTLQGYTPDDFLGNSAESLSVGQLLVGQADTVGVSKTLAGIATIDASGNLIYTSGSISHTGLTNIGTNTHAQIDSHISSTANPHTVTASQVGNTVSQWNASSIEGNVTNLGTLGSSDNGKVISWDNATSRFVMSNINDDSIYANDGTLAGNRAVNGSGTRSLSFGNDVASENLSILKINSIQGLEHFASTFPFANAGLEVTKNPGNFIANLKASATDSVKIQLTSDEHRVVSVLGTNNLQQTNSSSISTTIVSNGGLGTTARLDLLGSGKVDLGTSGTVGASLVLDSTNSFTDRNATPKGLEYSADYSANFSNRSLVDKEYVDNNSGGGILGIADSSGVYTYYATFALAMAAASSGDTIQLFTNIIETNNITVSCVNGVNINFNGFTYTLNNSGNAHAFTISGSAVNIEFFNGKVLRTGNGSGSALYVSASGLLTVQGVIFENDFGQAGSFNGSSLIVLGGYYYGATIGVFLNSGRFENGYCRGGSSYGLWIQNNGTAIKCSGYSLSNYGIENNASNAYSCVGRSDGNYGFNAGGGSSYDCKGYSSASYGLRVSGAAKISNVFGYSSANAGIILLGGTGTNITGYSTSSYGVNYQSGSGDHIISNVTAYSTAAKGMYVLKNAGKVEFSNIDVGTAWNSASGHALEVTGSDNDIFFSGGSLRVQNASANCIYSGAAKSCYFVGLKFNNSTTAVNANITNLQSNTPDAFGNILIG